MSGRILDWHLSQQGFDPSFGNLASVAILKSSDRTKQVCLWMTIYIYIYIYIYIKKGIGNNQSLIIQCLMVVMKFRYIGKFA